MAPTPVEVVQKLLANTRNAEVLNELVAPDATYVSLNYSNSSLTKILPYAGTHAKSGPEAINYTFTTVNTIWTNEAFEVQALFGSGEDVAVFGTFTYRSNTLGKACTSPFSIWCKVNADGKVTYMQFMEDTLGTTDTFKKEGVSKYYVQPDAGEFEL